ncbi:MFS transporter [Altererythrobacter salegens]|uniref:MFS transporter n=1 Tax=Croceibacterium salegens TaxID=1737568 RepID=A0A6I4SZM8_9SPHN|nr:peptide MFS transporter [Croceibacterium salegens]MXO59762.1 MFS transporter [Croceibacterium salegens]
MKPEVDRSLFLGHPKGLVFLSMTEAWERFSFYGMRGLLVLYMVQELLLPGRIEKVAGMEGFRAVVEGVFGPLTTTAFASQTFGLYAGFVYFTPLFGGIIADRWLGAKKTVLIGIALMTAGHLSMSFDASFLLALLLLVLGSGCLKGNVAAQVGHLYPHDDEARRTRGFTIFSTGINIGATLGPLLCGLLAQVYGWHFGFGLAAVMMLLAGAVYLAGWRHFADDRPRAMREAGGAVQPANWRMLGLVFLIVALNLFWILPYDQGANVGMIWVAESVDLSTPFGVMPAAWFNSEDPFASILIAPVLVALWSWQGKRGTEPHDTGKMAQGSVVMALSVLALAAGAWQAGDAGKASVIWPLISYFLSGVAFMFSWPTVLAMVSRRAPAGVNAMAVAAAYLALFISGIVVGWLGRFYEQMPHWQFWLIHAAMCLAGAVLLAVLGPMLRRRMDALDAEA